MLPGMRSFFFVAFATMAFTLACGGKSISPDDGDADAGAYGRGGDGGGDGSNGYVDPHCADAAPPPSDITCDVFDQKACGAGKGCFPAVIPPQYECETETYGSFCLSAGAGKQGSPCGDTEGCAAGFVCLITGSTTECAALCSLGGTTGCSNGFVCEPIDVPGFSACL